MAMSRYHSGTYCKSTANKHKMAAAFLSLQKCKDTPRVVVLVSLLVILKGTQQRLSLRNLCSRKLK